jgi:hypothetical protein
MKKAAKVEYGIQITKPWSREMYDHNDEVAEQVRAAVHQMWMDAWNECEREVTDMDEESDLLIYMDWDVASEEMKRIQKAVLCHGFGSGYSVADVAERVEAEIEDAPYYRLKDIAEELGLELEKGFVGFN